MADLNKIEQVTTSVVDNVVPEVLNTIKNAENVANVALKSVVPSDTKSFTLQKIENFENSLNDVLDKVDTLDKQVQIVIKKTGIVNGQVNVLSLLPVLERVTVHSAALSTALAYVHTNLYIILGVVGAIVLKELLSLNRFKV